LKDNNIELRALESSDLNWLFAVENNPDFWEVSNTIQPFSRTILSQYISNAHQDIFTVKQLRLVITHKEISVGLIDIFDFDPKNHRAGIGILVLPKFQSKGFATSALQLVIKYAFDYLQLHQIYANILSDNAQSIELFQKLGFEIVGNKEEWIFHNGNYKDELLLQLIKGNND
jgi:diamine N-acetyltransferase